MHTNIVKHYFAEYCAHVQTWTAPRSAYLVNQLKCGEEVNVLDYERGYARIQIVDHFAYVDAKYLKTASGSPSRQGQAAPTQAASRRGWNSGDVPAAEVFVGYSLLGMDTIDFLERQWFHGWEASVSANFNRHIAVEVDVTGEYKRYNLGDYGSAWIQVYSFLGGPRLNFGPFYAHVLVGPDIVHSNAFGVSDTQVGITSVFGGGVQFPVSDLVSLRGGADYALSRHDDYMGSYAFQNNFRASAGIVFKIGKR
jgi:hypothetical protein